MADEVESRSREELVEAEATPGLRRDIGQGEFFTVPAGVIHREGNLTDEVGEAIVVRFGEGPPVFPADRPAPG